MDDARRPSLDERITTFLRVWAAGSVAARNGKYAQAVSLFLDAARQAPTYADETKSLERAFSCDEQLHGRYAPRMDDPE